MCVCAASIILFLVSVWQFASVDRAVFVILRFCNEPSSIQSLQLLICVRVCPRELRE